MAVFNIVFYDKKATSVFETRDNKSTLTGPSNCKKTTKFTQFRGQISPNSKFF